MLNKFFTLSLLIFYFFINVPVQAQVNPEAGKDSVEISAAEKRRERKKQRLERKDREEGENSRFLKRAVLPSAVLIGAGIYTIGERGFFSSIDLFDYRSKAFPQFSTDADDFIMLAPLVGLYSINLISNENRHDIARQSFLLLASGLATTTLVWPTKVLTDIDRPNGDNHAFPSGHTAYAFTIATFMDKEFRHSRPWVSVVSYTVAGATGILRVLNNAHWMADVLAGAGVGILSVNLVYWLHSKIVKENAVNAMVWPVMLPDGNVGMGLSWKF